MKSAAPPHFIAHRQLLADFWLEDVELLRRIEPLWGIVYEAAQGSGAVILGECIHQFEPDGFTAMLLLAQSHVSVHTWVDEGLLLLDVQTCGAMQPEIIVARLREALRPREVVLQHLERAYPVPNWRSPASPRPGTM